MAIEASESSGYQRVATFLTRLPSSIVPTVDPLCAKTFTCPRLLIQRKRRFLPTNIYKPWSAPAQHLTLRQVSLNTRIYPSSSPISMTTSHLLLRNCSSNTAAFEPSEVENHTSIIVHIPYLDIPATIFSTTNIPTLPARHRMVHLPLAGPASASSSSSTSSSPSTPPLLLLFLLLLRSKIPRPSPLSRPRPSHTRHSPPTASLSAPSPAPTSAPSTNAWPGL